MKSNSPPRFAGIIFKLLLDEEAYGERTGDIEEIYLSICRERGPLLAKLWILWEVIKAIPTFIKESIHWKFIMFKNYLKIALRNLKRYKAYSFINILGLTIGITAFILISFYVQYELSFDRYHDNADRIFRVEVEVKGNNAHYKEVFTPALLAPTLIEKVPDVISAARVFRRNTGKNLFYCDEIAFYGDLRYADSETFEIFSFPFKMGDPETALQEPCTLVISEHLAERYFKDENPINKVLTHSRTGNPYTIKGVFKNIPHNSYLSFDMVTSMETIYSPRGLNWGNVNWDRYTHTFLLLQRGASKTDTELKINEIINKYVNKINRNESLETNYLLRPLTNIHLHSNIQGEFKNNYNIKYIYIYSSVGILILILVCINYIGLEIAKSIQRFKEIGVRKVIGAERKQLIIQFLCESSLIQLSAISISILLTMLVLPACKSLIGLNLSNSIVDYNSFYIVIFVVIVFNGLFCGCYPAIIISALRPVNIINRTINKNLKGKRLRNLVVITQFSITLILIISTLTIKSQLNFIQNLDVGYDKENILVLHNFEPYLQKNLSHKELLNNQLLIKEELLKNPKIAKVAFSSTLPNNVFIRGKTNFPAKDKNKPILFQAISIDFDFLDVYDIQILEGRGFSRDFPGDFERGVLINEAAAKACEWKSPIGKEFNFWGSRKRNIVGIVNDFHSKSLHHPIVPTFLTLFPGHANYASIKINNNDMSKTIGYIRNIFKQFIPNYQFQYNFFDEVFDRDYKSEKTMEYILGIFVFISIIIACMGLFGTTMFIANQRTKEIGLRKVLGASIPNILALLAKELVFWISISAVIVFPASYFYINKFLQNFAYRVSYNIWIFILSVLAVMAIAILTICYHIIKAATANPVDSLRYE